jgi:hypothetical protein
MIASGMGQSNMWYASAWYMLKDEEQKVEQEDFQWTSLGPAWLRCHKL